MSVKALFFVGLVFFMGTAARGNQEEGISGIPGRGAGTARLFRYTAHKLGLPILHASIRIENGFSEQGKNLYRIQAQVDSAHLGLLFRMNNRFASTVEAETCIPIRYVKEVNQGGLLVQDKNYLQTLTFDPLHKRVWVEKRGTKERQEVPLPPETYDPLSMFARFYLKESLSPGEDLRMSIYDGVKVRSMVFHYQRESVKSKLLGEVDAIRLESSTSFASFGEKEGTIRIWYTHDGKKTPILMELDLPVGSVRFELEGAEDR